MEQMLWDAACFIRGEKDAAKGKDHRLPSLSLKHLSDVFDAAIDRLAESAEAVSEIGFDLGFSSQASFSRFFIANGVVPPSTYRRSVHVARPH